MLLNGGSGGGARPRQPAALRDIMPLFAAGPDRRGRISAHGTVSEPRADPRAPAAGSVLIGYHIALVIAAAGDASGSGHRRASTVQLWRMPKEEMARS